MKSPNTGYIPIRNSILPDANIWFSSTLHSWFGLLSAELLGDWRFYWTEDIIAEAQYAKRRAYRHSSSHQIEAIRDRLMEVIPENRIQGYEIDNSVNYPDPDDAHVHSAALHARIQIIVTDDKSGFKGIYPSPEECPYEVYTADEFLMLVADSSPRVIDAVINNQQKYYSKKQKSFNLPKKLRAAGCPKFAD